MKPSVETKIEELVEGFIRNYTKNTLGIAGVGGAHSLELREANVRYIKAEILALVATQQAQMRDKIKGIHLSKPQHSCPDEGMCADCIYEEGWNGAIADVLNILDKEEK